MSAAILEQLEISGLLASMLIFAYGLYKLIVLKGLNSRCGWVSVDLRSASTRQKELELNHELELAKLEVEKLKYTTAIPNYHVVTQKDVQETTDFLETLKGSNL